MIIIKGTMRIRPEGREAAIAAGTEMMAATHTEPGNLAYVYAFAFDDPELVHVYEEWEDEAALSSHMASEHMADFSKKLPTFAAPGGGGFFVHEIAESRKLF